MLSVANIGLKSEDYPHLLRRVVARLRRGCGTVFGRGGRATATALWPKHNDVTMSLVYITLNVTSDNVGGRNR